MRQRDGLRLSKLWRRTCASPATKTSNALAARTNLLDNKSAGSWTLRIRLSCLGYPGLILSLGIVRLCCQAVEQVKERRGLANEESIICQTLNRPHRRILRFRGTNN